MTLFRNEISGSVYSYSLYHATLCLANMYITMQLTQWFQPQVRMLALDCYNRWIDCSSSLGVVRINKISKST